MKHLYTTFISILILSSSSLAQDDTPQEDSGSSNTNLDSCQKAVQAVKDSLPNFYNAGRTMEINNAMTPEYQKQFDGYATQVTQAISLSCQDLTPAQITQISESVFSSPENCKSSSGDFINSCVQTQTDNGAIQGNWDALYSFAKVCQA